MSDRLPATAASAGPAARPADPARAAGKSATRAATAAQVSALPADPLPGAALALRQRVTARAASKPVCRSPVAIRGAAAVMRIVRPVAAASAYATDSAYTTYPSAAATDVGIALEVVVVVDIGATASPTAAPAPTAAPKGPCFASASASSLSFKFLFFSSQRCSRMISREYVDAASTWANIGSGYRATGATRESSCSAGIFAGGFAADDTGAGACCGAGA